MSTGRPSAISIPTLAPPPPAKQSIIKSLLIFQRSPVYPCPGRRLAPFLLFCSPLVSPKFNHEFMIVPVNLSDLGVRCIRTAFLSQLIELVTLLFLPSVHISPHKIKQCRCRFLCFHLFQISNTVPEIIRIQFNPISIAVHFHGCHRDCHQTSKRIQNHISFI